jgi:NADH-quinone oxidoreductase subunit H
MTDLLIDLLKTAVLIFAFITAAAYLIYTERKVIGYLQVRIGPNRVGPFGMLQSLADVIKLATKEDVRPAGRDNLLYVLAPGIMVMAALAAFAVIPVSPDFSIFGTRFSGYIANLNVGVLYIFAVSGMSVYGIVLGGWASNSKYSLLGAMRSAAQIISYEMALGFSLVGVFIVAGSVNPNDIVAQQHRFWYVLLQPLGFALYAISATAEINRAPFDLPEADTELTAGYLTEYAGLKWALYFLGEYINMITISAIAVSLFLGGWQGPVLPGVMWFAIKVAFMIFLLIWLRATLPRVRYDRLMTLGWKVLLPLTLLNIVLSATLVVLGYEAWLLPAGILLLVVIALVLAARTRAIPHLRAAPAKVAGASAS